MSHPPPIIPATRRVLRVLGRLGVSAQLVLERLDGAPLSAEEVDACTKAIAALDEFEALADRSTREAGVVDPAATRK